MLQACDQTARVIAEVARLRNDEIAAAAKMRLEARSFPELVWLYGNRIGSHLRRCNVCLGAFSDALWTRINPEYQKVLSAQRSGADRLPIE